MSDNGLFDVNSLYEEEEQKKEKKKSRLFKGKEVGNKTAIVIGIHGAHRGCGVTSLCVELAKELCKNKDVAIVERNSDDIVRHIKIKGVDTYKCEFREVDSRQYDYIFIDFGHMYDIDKTDVAIIQNSKEEIRNKQDEYWKDTRYCDKNILVCSCLPWRLNETRFYLDDSAGDNTIFWIKYITGDTETKEFKEFMRDYYTDDIVLDYKNDNKVNELIKLINNK